MERNITNSVHVSFVCNHSLTDLPFIYLYSSIIDISLAISCRIVHCAGSAVYAVVRLTCCFGSQILRIFLQGAPSACAFKEIILRV
jgi:hypothetical protein